MNHEPTNCYKLVIDALNIVNSDRGDMARLHVLLESRIHLLKYDFAIILEDWFDKALAKASSEQRQQYASLVGNLGLGLYSFDKGDAEINYLIAIRAFECALLVFTKSSDPFYWASSVMKIGQCYIARAEYAEDPISCLDKAVKQLREAVKVFAEIQDQMGQASALNSLGNAFLDKSELVLHPAGYVAKAISLYSESILLSEAADDDSGIARALNNLGNAYRAMAELTVDPGTYINRCKEAHLKSAEIRKRLNEQSSWATSMNDLANAHHDFARYDSDPETSYRLAAVGYIQALKATPKRLHPMDFASCSTNLGNCRISLASVSPTVNRKKLIQKAVMSYSNALQCYDTKYHPRHLATLNTYLANARLELLPYIECTDSYVDSILESYVYALRVYSSLKSPRDIARIQSRLGVAHLYLARFGKDVESNARQAIKILRGTLEVYTEASHPSTWAQINSDLGEALIILASFEKDPEDCIHEAVGRYKDALRIQDPLGHSADCLRTSLKLGNLALNHNMQALAISSYSVSIAAAESLRFTSLGPQDRVRTHSRAMQAYSSLFSLYISQGMYDKALEIADRSKARNLVDLLASRDLYPRGRFKNSIITNLNRLRGLIARAERTLFSASGDNQFILSHHPRLANESFTLNYSGSKSDSSPSVTLSLLTPARLKSLKEELAWLIRDQILPVDPGFSLSQQVQPLTYSDIKAVLSGDRTALVSWYIARESLVALITTANSQAPVCHIYSDLTLQNLIDKCSSYLNAYRTNTTLWALSLSERLMEISKLLEIEVLVKKILSIDPEADQLLLVPHRFLHIIPLHCLPMPESKSTLLESFSKGVRFAPSLQVLDIVQKRPRLELSSLFAIQNPTEDLPFSELEVECIQAHFESGITVLSRKQASRRSLEKSKNILKGIRCLHFACHGEFNFLNPESSSLVLAKSSFETSSRSQDSESFLLEEDGNESNHRSQLSLLDLFEFDLRQARIVSLSACETALTEINGPSDEFVGLSSGFLYAGCNTVVGTLWSVNDLSTCLIMDEFYRILKAHKGSEDSSDASSALKQAQLWLRKLKRDEVLQRLSQLADVSSGPSKNDCTTASAMITRSYLPDELIFSNPYYWAGFSVVGQ